VLFRDVYFAAGEDILTKPLFLASHDEFLVLLEVKLVGGIYESILCPLNEDINLIVGL
jgi:hypothetical protein